MRVASGLIALVAGACSLNVDYTGTLYQCGPAGECPSNYTCVGGFCLPDEAQGTTCALEVTAGQSHTCAVRTDGQVWCWGNIDQGPEFSVLQG